MKKLIVLMGMFLVGVAAPDTVHAITVRSTPRITRTPQRVTHIDKQRNNGFKKETSNQHNSKNYHKSTRTGSFNKHAGYGVKRPYPAYRSDGLGTFQRILLFSIFAHSFHRDNGVLIVKDTQGKEHRVNVPKDVYRKWRNDGNQLVYKDKHVYVIKTNQRIA